MPMPLESEPETGCLSVRRPAQPVVIDITDGADVTEDDPSASALASEATTSAQGRLDDMLEAFRRARRERATKTEGEIVIDRVIADTGPASLRADLASSEI
ncbi:MAG: hypothetical protein KJO43_13525 [Phycisphaerae bacterium]|nr:hypothetical protein [Phycisphaerae bacterium]NNF44727.1 hypothetical protein [Phycisphaerales bacterium]